MIPLKIMTSLINENILRTHDTLFLEFNSKQNSNQSLETLLTGTDDVQG